MTHQDLVTAASFSPDGSEVVTASNDQTARVWQIPATKLPDSDLQEFAELISARRIDATNALCASPSTNGVCDGWT